MRKWVSPAAVPAGKDEKNKKAPRISPRLGLALSLLGTAALYLLLSLTGRGCPIRALTGIPCPGCGLTRAYLCLFRGDLRGALYYHPLFWAVPLPLLLLLKSGPFGRRGVRAALRLTVGLLLAAALLLYLLRLLIWKNSAVYLPLFGGKT